VRGGFVLRYDEIQGRLDKGGSYQLEILKLLCEIADTLLYIKDDIKMSKNISTMHSKFKEDQINLNHLRTDMLDRIAEEPVKDDLYAYTKTITTPIKKRGRPPKRR
jgi:hypothetical protein